MTILRSEEWSNAHMAVNDLLSELLNQLRDRGYNPSLHIHYDNAVHRLTIDGDILNQHQEIQTIYEQYQSACDRRDAAVEQIQTMPKLDIGF